MPGMPELPINLGDEALQADGNQDNEHRYQTHRGKKTNRDVTPPPAVHYPDGYGRYED